MATETSTQRKSQEQSIKARKKELYFEEEYVDSGPRKTFREYLRETPATPLSKHVKLMLWGSAAPVLLLFLGALLTIKGSIAKPPERSVLPPSPPKLEVVRRNDEPPPKEAIAPKEEKPKEEAQKKEKTPDEEKPKKPKKPKKPTDEARKSGKSDAKTDKPEKDENGSKPKAGEPEKKMPNPASSTEEKEKGKSKSDLKSKPADTAPSPEPEKSKRPRLFPKRKAPVFTYPKREGEKKDEKSDSEKTNPSP